MNIHAHTEMQRSPAEVNGDLLLTCSRTLLSGIASSILVLRPSGRIAFANKAAEVMIGRSSAQLAGEDFSAIFAEDTAAPKTAPEAPGASRRGRLRIHGNAQLPVRIEINPLQTETEGLQGSVVTIEDMSDLLQMDEFVKQMLRSDTLTGLPREDALAAAMDTALIQLHSTGRSFALLELNVDQFRRIKESLGHDAATGALREIATRLVTTVRRGDVVTRNTSDSFTILLTNCESQQDAVARAEAVLGAFKQPFRFGPYCTHVTASIGMSFSRPGTVSCNSFSTEAELALRRCKALGGNRVVCFDPSMADWHSYAVQMESQMQSALANEEFYVVYQPQVCCQTGRLIGVESLLRWQSPTSGLVMPTIFIPAAEESGLIVQLGEWCLRTACKEIVSLQQTLGYPVRLAVNVSPKQIYAPGFKDFVRQTLEETGLSPELLELEITEGLLISHEEEAVKAINSIQELGVSMAMDDFGMGFSNLSYINRFKINRLKIDRSFIMRCPGDHNSRMITTSLVFLAKSLGIEVVAEGVETEEQASLLADLRCDLAQGYLYSRPTTAAEIYTLAINTAANPKNKQQAQESRPEKPSGQAGGDASASAPSLSAFAVTDAPVPVITSVTAVAFPPPQAAAESAAPVHSGKPDTLPEEAALHHAEADTSAKDGEPADLAQLAEAASSATVEPADGAAEANAPLNRRNQAGFATHTILVPASEPKARSSNENASPAEKRKHQRREQAATTAYEAPLEPLEPVCRPSRPQRLPGAMRISWRTVPDGEAV